MVIQMKISIVQLLLQSPLDGRKRNNLPYVHKKGSPASASTSATTPPTAISVCMRSFVKVECNDAGIVYVDDWNDDLLQWSKVCTTRVCDPEAFLAKCQPFHSE